MLGKIVNRVCVIAFLFTVHLVKAEGYYDRDFRMANRDSLYALNLKDSFSPLSDFMLDYFQGGLVNKINREFQKECFNISFGHGGDTIPNAVAVLNFSPVGFVSPYLGYQDYEHLLEIHQRRYFFKIVNKQGFKDSYEIESWFKEPQYNRQKRSFDFAYILKPEDGEREKYVLYKSYLLTNTGYFIFKTLIPIQYQDQTQTMHAIFWEGFTLNTEEAYNIVELLNDTEYRYTVSRVIGGYESVSVSMASKILKYMPFLLLIFIVITSLLWKRIWALVGNERTHNL